MAVPLWIVGASARAAAFSALRGGYAPSTADLFADVDLAAQCPAVAVQDYPRGLLAEVQSGPACPWLYTGAIENAPDLVDAIAAGRPLLGNPGRVLREVRDPSRWTRALASAGLAVCDVAETPRELPVDGSWLRKPRRSAGGARIEPWTKRAAPVEPGDFYFQRRQEGMACSAVFVAAQGEAALLGVTEQLVGETWLHARPFHYAGSLGPLPLTDPVRQQWRKIGRVLAAAFALTGLFGVDAILAEDELWPVEINPRYTASIEILERALGFSAVAIHVDACRTGKLPAETDRRAPSDSAWHGKAILFAPQESSPSEAFVQRAMAANHEPLTPAVADIPRADIAIPKGAPVLTCLAAAPSSCEVVARLQERVGEFEGLLRRGG